MKMMRKEEQEKERRREEEEEREGMFVGEKKERKMIRTKAKRQSERDEGVGGVEKGEISFFLCMKKTRVEEEGI